MHILSNRTGLSHTSASTPVIRVKNQDSVDLENADGCIFGTYFALVLRDEDGLGLWGNNLRIYNWKTGELIKVSSPSVSTLSERLTIVVLEFGWQAHMEHCCLGYPTHPRASITPDVRATVPRYCRLLAGQR